MDAGRVSSSVPRLRWAAQRSGKPKRGQGRLAGRQGSRIWDSRCVVMAKLPLAGVDFRLRSAEIGLTSRFGGCLRRLADGSGRRGRHILSKCDCLWLADRLRPTGCVREPSGGAGSRRRAQGRREDPQRLALRCRTDPTVRRADFLRTSIHNADAPDRERGQHTARHRWSVARKKFRQHLSTRR